MNSKLKNFILSLLPAVLFYLAWPPGDLFFLSFIALVPLFILEQKVKGKWAYGLWVFFSIILFNTFTTWWVWYASPEGALVMIFTNSLLLSLPFWLLRWTKAVFRRGKALMAFVFYWLSVEYLHLNWEINWPWLDLGNVFAKHNLWVQWYEYTGMLGGSLWILLVNVLVYLLIVQKSRTRILQLILLILCPALISLLIYNSLDENPDEKLNTLVVQPNIDPYKKFDSGTEINNLKLMLEMVEEGMHDSIGLIVMPETAIVEYMDEDDMKSFDSYWLVRNFIAKYPKVHLVSGASTYNFYDENERRSPTARKTPYGEEYESYNTALEFDVHGVSNTYHKMKLVPGVEKMPYPQIFGFLESLSLDLGGVTGSLGSDPEPGVFELDNKPDVAPLICYESVFPGFVAEFVRKGADIILVITNDGWWRSTDGYKQHMYYACLRAIENRKEVIRSANTGISCHINYKGQILETTDWWTQELLHAGVKVHRQSTFYTKYGDYIGRFASFLGVFLMLGVFVKRRVKHD